MAETVIPKSIIKNNSTTTDNQNPPYDYNIILEYHQRTKHRFEAYARGPETLDWDDQPNVFRTYADTSKIRLPLACGSGKPFTEFFYESPSPDANLESPKLFNKPSLFNKQNISEFLRLAFSLSAWKQLGPDLWSLRVNPSSGNLHPTETYLIIPNDLFIRAESTESSHIPSGLWHYAPFDHSLEQRCDLSVSSLPGFFVAFSSIVGRESWKYGERAFRYSQLDVGHAVSCAAFSAKNLGWQSCLIENLNDHALNTLLGFNDEQYLQTLRSEDREHFECLLFIYSGDVANATIEKAVGELLSNNVDLSSDGACLNSFKGVPNRLGGRTPYKWPIIQKVIAATETKIVKTDYAASIIALNSCDKPLDNPVIPACFGDKPFSQVALNRRSAQRFDKSELSFDDFVVVLESLQNYGQPILSDSECDKNTFGLDFIFLVHNVQGLVPGIYGLGNSASGLLQLQDLLSTDLKNHDLTTANKIATTELKTLNDKYALKLLQPLDCRKLAARICCQQAIASDCAFTIGFLAPMSAVLNARQGLGYKQMFRQAGVLAQQVYFAATAKNFAATGIGCFFDDPFHELLGLNGFDYQFVYQMAVGRPIVDERITRFSGYYHLKNEENLLRF